MDPINPGLAAPQVTHEGTPETPVRKRRGCFFYVFLSSLLLALIATSAIGIFGRRVLSRQVQKYTADRAIQLPQADYSAEDLSQLEQRLRQIDMPDRPVEVVINNAATDDLAERGETPSESNRPPGPGDLVLSARDINALVARNPQLRGKVFVTIDNGKIGGEVSLPMPSVPGGEGRFFNASAIFHVEIRDAQLFVTVTDAYVKEKRAPKILLDAIAGENLASEINQHPRMKPRLEKFESLSIVDDKVILRAKTGTANRVTSDDSTTNPDNSTSD